MNLKKCPRCNGFLYRPYPKIYTTFELKCFSCSRLFYLETDSLKPHWIQWPHRNEEYKIVYENPQTVKALVERHKNHWKNDGNCLLGERDCPAEKREKCVIRNKCNIAIKKMAIPGS